jgi:Sec-independent protein translocase protein TatA
VFGVGPQELMILSLLLLVVFGSHKASSMARDVGHFVKETRRPVEEFKAELAAVVEVGDEPASHLNSGNGEDGARKRATNSKLRGKEETRKAPSEDMGVPTE